MYSNLLLPGAEMEKRRARIIYGYERALELSREMLGHAGAGQWEQLIALEHDYLHEIDELRTQDTITLDSDRQAHKKELLSQLLTNDQQLHSLLQQRLADLGEQIGKSRVQQQVSRAYGAASVPMGE